MSETSSETAPSMWRSPWVRAAIVGVVVIAAAAIIKDRQDRARFDVHGAREAAREQLVVHHKALRERLSAASDGEAAIKALPTLTAWYPAELPCGLERVKAPSLPGELAALGVTVPKDGMVTHQLRFQRRGDEVIWRARRDGDCDGIFEAHTLKTSLSWTGSFSNHVVSQQTGE